MMWFFINFRKGYIYGKKNFEQSKTNKRIKCKTIKIIKKVEPMPLKKTLREVINKEAQATRDLYGRKTADKVT